MRKEHMKEELVTTTIVDDIICNKCGKSFKPVHIAGSLYYNPQVHNFEVKFNYGCKNELDNKVMTYELCDECIEEYVKSFKHAPDIKERL